ncbi:MAG: HI0074 family nucleotidyltransferase substrate-binding subunit [Armatimonadota bacterium]
MSKSRDVLSSLERAMLKFEESSHFPDDEVHLDSQIQRFEFTFELCGKLMRAMLADGGNPTFGVNLTFRTAAAAGYIDNPREWIDYADTRNKASHVYDEEMARAVLAVALGPFIADARKFLTFAQTYLAKNNDQD